MRHFDLTSSSLSEEIKRRNIDILSEIPFPFTEERISFAQSCMKHYEKHYPEAIDEILSLSKGLKIDEKLLFALFFSMYAIIPNAKCSCVAIRDENNLMLARNSDFYKSMKELNSHFTYKNYYGNSTAFIELEDGKNKDGLAIGFTSVFPQSIKSGLNSGLILRLLLEKADSCEKAISILHSIPIASSQTFIMADRAGTIAYVECSANNIKVIKHDEGRRYLLSTNRFILSGMKDNNNARLDDWNAEARHNAMEKEIRKESFINLEKMKAILKSASIYPSSLDHDTVWSVIEDLKKGYSYLCEGNPKEESFKII